MFPDIMHNRISCFFSPPHPVLNLVLVLVLNLTNVPSSLKLTLARWRTYNFTAGRPAVLTTANVGAVTLFPKLKETK